MTDFLVRRDDLRVHRADGGEAALVSTAEGTVQFRVERFGLTANNLTYGVLGDAMGYWRFFPAPEGWGRIPVWGFGEVQVSGVEGILPAVPAAGFAPAHDDASVIMRPLFLTGWVLADHLAADGWHGAGVVVLASASSKTAYATASAIRERDGSLSLIGLTSAANRAFTAGLGVYDEVLTYADVGALPTAGGVVLVDMSGDAGVRRAVHESAGDDLRASIMVGGTHWEGATFTGDGLPCPEPTMFFAPSVAEERAAAVGPAEFARQIGAAWSAFADRVPGLVEIEHGTGADALAAAYTGFVEGHADPRKGLVFTL